MKQKVLLVTDGGIEYAIETKGESLKIVVSHDVKGGRIAMAADHSSVGLVHVTSTSAITSGIK